LKTFYESWMPKKIIIYPLLKIFDWILLFRKMDFLQRICKWRKTMDESSILPIKKIDGNH
jgi:hypothetical protein